MQRQSMIGSCLLAQDVIYETRCNVDEDPTKVSMGLKNMIKHREHHCLHSDTDTS